MPLSKGAAGDIQWFQCVYLLGLRTNFVESTHDTRHGFKYYGIMAKKLVHLRWIEDILPDGFLRKHMFGGLGYYVNGQIVLAVFENTGQKTYKKQTFDFEIWNGCLFPTEREHHEKIKKIFPFLITHPVLTKWLYLPANTEDFDASVEEILKKIRMGSKLFGVTPKPKKKRLKQ